MDVPEGNEQQIEDEEVLEDADQSLKPLREELESLFDIPALDSARLLDHCLSKAQLAILSELFDSVKADESQKALALAVLGCVDAEKK